MMAFLLIIGQGRVLREFSPEEVTANIYTMVDVLLHHIHLELQRGHPLQVYLFLSDFHGGSTLLALL